MEMPTGKKRRRENDDDADLPSAPLSTPPYTHFSNTIEPPSTTSEDMIDPYLNLDASSYRYVTELQDAEATSDANLDLQDFNPPPDDPFDVFNDPSKFASLFQSHVAEEDDQPAEPSKPLDSDNTLQPKQPEQPEVNTDALMSNTTNQTVTCPPAQPAEPVPTISDDGVNISSPMGYATNVFDLAFKDPEIANGIARLEAYCSQTEDPSENERASNEAAQTYTGGAEGHQPAMTANTPKGKPIASQGQWAASAPARINHPVANTNTFISPPTSRRHQRRPSPKKTPTRTSSQMVKGYATMPQLKSSQNMPSSRPGNHTMANVSFNDMSPPAPKRVRPNKTRQETGYLTFNNPHGEVVFSEVDSIMAGFGDFLNRHSITGLQNQRVAANQQPLYTGMGPFTLSTYFANPVNFKNNQWIGSSMSNLAPPLSEIRQQTGYDYPVPRVSGILASIEQAQDLLRQKQQAKTTMMGTQLHHQLSAEVQPPRPVSRSAQQQTQAYQNTHVQNNTKVYQNIPVQHQSHIYQSTPIQNQSHFSKSTPVRKQSQVQQNGSTKRHTNGTQRNAAQHQIPAPQNGYVQQQTQVGLNYPVQQQTPVRQNFMADHLQHQAVNSPAGHLQPQTQHQVQFAPQMHYQKQTPQIQSSPVTPGSPRTGMGLSASRQYNMRDVTPTPAPRRTPASRPTSHLSTAVVNAQVQPQPALTKTVSAPAVAPIEKPVQSVENPPSIQVPDVVTPQKNEVEPSAPASGTEQYSTGNTPMDFLDWNMTTTPAGPAPTVTSADLMISNLDPPEVANTNTNVHAIPELDLTPPLNANPSSETEATLLALGVDLSNFAHTPQPAVLTPAVVENEASAPAITANNNDSTPPHVINGVDGSSLGTSVDNTDLGLPSEGLPGFEFDFDMFNESQPFNSGDRGF